MMVEQSQGLPRATQTGAMHSFVVFRLGRTRYALPLDQVELVLRMVAATSVPDSPRWVVGAIDLHGRVLPVADLRERLGHPPKDAHVDDRLLIVSHDERTFALVVDEVTEVLDVPGDAVAPPPDPICTSRYLSSVVRREEGLILVLNSAHLFPDRDVLSARERIQ